MKTLFQAIGMALILFAYGYFLSIAGHDHSSHQGNEGHHNENAMPNNLPTPFHPMVIHFPIALFITALVLEILAWLSRKNIFHQCSVCLYVLAALITPLIVRTGLWEAERLHLNHPLLDQHQTFALWTMWTALMSLPVLWFFYHKSPEIFRVLFVLCLINSSILVSFTGDRGGRMVFEYGAGVEE